MGVLIGTALLSGCSEKQEANTSLPSSSATETTSDFPPLGPQDMPMPHDARTQDAAGAEAFVRYYFDLINRMTKTLDTESLRQLSDGCDDCERIIMNAETSAKSNYSYEGGQITVTEVAPPLVRADTADMAVRVDQTALAVLDASGNRVEEGSSNAFVGIPANVSLAWDPALKSWQMTYLAFG